MRLWATGVTIVTAEHDGFMRGTTVSSFTSVTLEPPLVLVCLQKTTETAQVIRDSQAFAVSMLGENQQYISNRFAGYDDLPDDEDRFKGIPYITRQTGSPIFQDAMGWVDCELRSMLDGNTHFIFMGAVVDASGEPDNPDLPLIYYNRGYRNLTPE